MPSELPSFPTIEQFKAKLRDVTHPLKPWAILASEALVALHNGHGVLLEKIALGVPSVADPKTPAELASLIDRALPEITAKAAAATGTEKTELEGLANLLRSFLTILRAASPRPTEATFKALKEETLRLLKDHEISLTA